jgi:flavin-dependent dehydrogenase
VSARYDVVVVGGRVAGAATAMLLARAGARVLVLDRSAYGSDTLSTHALMRGGVLQLARWGLLDRLVAAGTPPVATTTFHVPDADPVRIRIRQAAGVDALYAPRRHGFDRMLVDAAAAAGAEVRHGVRVTGLLRDRRDRVTGVTVAGTHGEERILAGHVVGADGIASTVAAGAGARVLVRGRNRSAVRHTYVEGLEVDGYRWAYGDGVAAGLIPTDGGRHCVFVSTTPERLRTLRLHHSPDQVFATMLRLAGADDLAGAGRRVERFHGWAGMPGYLRQPWGPGWVLVGDAGYFKDPISTHGMTDALRDAELVADALAGVASGTPERTALGGYHRRRDQLSHRLFRVSDEIAAYDWDGASVQPLLRRLSGAMTDEVEYLEARAAAGLVAS